MRIAQQLSVAILCLLCAAALYGGYQLVTDPTGNSLHLPFYLLRGTVFSDYTVIGWIMLITEGLFSLFILLLMLFNGSVYPFFMILQGVFLCIFILVQLLLFPERFFVQYLFLFLGAGLVGLGIWQNYDKIIVESKKKSMQQ